MTYMSIGDLAASLQMRMQNASLQRQVQALAREMSTGQRSDLASAVGRDFSALASIDRNLAALGSFGTAAAEADLFTGSLQAALGQVSDVTDTLAPQLMSASGASSDGEVTVLARNARSALASVVASLNVNVAGRYVMAGTATDTRPVAGEGAILAALRAATAGIPTASGVAQALSDWFDGSPGGGGYLDLAYQGSATPPGPFAVGEGELVSVGVTAASPEIRNLLKGLATAALVADGALSGDRPGRATLLRQAGTALASAGGGLVTLRADLGNSEARIAAVAARNAAESSTLGIARSGIVAADPYETATRLQEVQTQLETLYTLTARMSRLSLAEVLR